MQINTLDQNNVKIVNLVGKLDTNTVAEAEACLIGLVDQGQQKILIDFMDLDFISSAGLRVLLLTTKKLSVTGGALRVGNLNETVQDIFDMSGFASLLQVFDDQQNALADF